MTPKGHRVIKGHCYLLYDPKGHVDLCVWFDLVYDPKSSQGHKRSPWPTVWPQMSRWPLWSVWPNVWPLKVTGSLEVAVTYFMTPKVIVTFVVGWTQFLTPRGHGVNKDQPDLLHDPLGKLDYWPWPWPKGQAFDRAGDHKCPGSTIMW